MKLQMRHSNNVSNKMILLSLFKLSEITENKIMLSAKVCHPAAFVAAHFGELRPDIVMDW